MTLKLYGNGNIENVDSIVTSASATLSATELGYIDGVTSAVQTQIDTKTSGGIGSWQSWTPTWSNLTVGNGTVDAKYTQIGNTVHFRLLFVFGSTSSVSGILQFGLPVTAAGSRTIISAAGQNAGSEDFPLHGYVAGGSCKLWVLRANATYLTYSNFNSTTPITWGTNDPIWASGTYEAA